MRFVKLTAKDGGNFYVNLDQIVAVYRTTIAGQGTFTRLVGPGVAAYPADGGGQVIYNEFDVKEPPEEVLRGEFRTPANRMGAASA